MAPFTSMLKPKKSKKARPHTPPSPSSFVSPRSPSWHEQAFTQHTKTRQPSGVRARDNIASKGDDEGSANIGTSGPSKPESSRLSPLPPSNDDLRPLSTGSDDIFSQISSYAFPLPPSDNKRELLGANGNQPPRVRFVNQEKPPNLQVSLHLSEEQSLEDMLFATGLLTGPRAERRRGNKEKETDPGSSTGSVSDPTMLFR